jgi:hypothetical protein
MSGPQASASGTTPATAAAAATGATQATIGAEAVQPPSTLKTVLGSVLRGALTGSSLFFSANKFFPGALPAVVNFAARFLPFIPAIGPVGIVGALAAGAVVGGLFGLIGGLRKAKAQREEYEQVVAAQEQPGTAPTDGQRGTVPVGDPLVIGPDGRPVPVDPGTNMPIPGAPGAPANVPTNPVMNGSYRGTSKAGRASNGGAKRRKGGGYTIKPGDTLGALAKKWGTTVAAIVKANPKITNPNLIIAGDTLRMP